jgi:hypothetical protein
VAEKQFLDFLGLSPEDRIRCIFETRRGKVISIKVVQYETLLHGKWTPVVRYDTAHGFFHRDVYLFGGKKHFKEFIYKPNLEEALNYAIDDIRQNWHNYKLAFLEQDNGKEKI